EGEDDIRIDATASGLTAALGWGVVRIDHVDEGEQLIIAAHGGDDRLDASAVDRQVLELALDGGAGDDLLVSGFGDETLLGGEGSDTIDYRASDGNVAVDLGAERAAGGYAQGDVISSIENVNGSGFSDVLTGSSETNVIKGGGGDDQIFGITGNDAGNLIAGGGGNDVLRGLGGSDAFLFDTALIGAGNVDRILDFSSDNDIIRLDNDVFEGLAEGALAAGAVRAGRTALQADDRILYDQASGALFYDADGSGDGAAAVRFATLQPGAELSAAEFLVVA
ncbi:MAG TPA: hypothetical protein VF589_02495, partial [Allosphingosinicella sp.]